MDRVRVFEQRQGAGLIQAELFPDISIGDAPAATPGDAPAPASAGLPPAREGEKHS